jgi:hypothetical protein
MYDTRCRNLAEYFLQDQEYDPAEVASLAQAIQDAIERWFEPRADRPKEITP